MSETYATREPYVNPRRAARAEARAKIAEMRREADAVRSRRLDEAQIAVMDAPARGEPPTRICPPLTRLDGIADGSDLADWLRPAEAVLNEVEIAPAKAAAKPKRKG